MHFINEQAPHKEKSHRFRYDERGGQSPLACYSGTEHTHIKKVLSSLKILAEKKSKIF